MNTVPFIQRKTLFTFALACVGILLLPAPKLRGDDPVSQPLRPQQTIQGEQVSDAQLSEGEQPADSKSTAMDDQYADDESPALGVLIGPCPGDAVCVTGTIWGSPAEEAGIRQGDYIVMVDGRKVSSPSQLKRLIDEHKSGDQVAVSIWRKGQRIQKKVVLASESDRLPDSHKAWLGVLLAEGDEGVIIEQVIPGGPASVAGIRPGDTVLRLGDSEVADVESLIERISDLGPGSELSLTIRRNGTETTKQIKLSHVSDAPMRFLRRAFRPPSFDRPPNFDRSFGSDTIVDETLDDMRRQIRELQDAVRELTDGDSNQHGRVDEENDDSGKQRKQPKQRSDRSESPAAENNISPSIDDGASTIETRYDRLFQRVDSSSTTLVADRESRVRDREGYRYRDNNFYDWGSRYRYRVPPIYRSPNYGYRYYRYGGRPYYYGEYRGFGPRYQIQNGYFSPYWF